MLPGDRAGNLVERVEGALRGSRGRSLLPEAVQGGQVGMALRFSDDPSLFGVSRSTGSSSGIPVSGSEGRFIFKAYAEPLRTYNEAVALSIYRLLRVPCPEPVLLDLGVGARIRLGLVHTMVPVRTQSVGSRRFLASEARLLEFLPGWSVYLADLWLANWDSGGLPDPRVTAKERGRNRMDVSGSLLFRRAGGRKVDALRGAFGGVDRESVRQMGRGEDLLMAELEQLDRLFRVSRKLVELCPVLPAEYGVGREHRNRVFRLLQQRAVRLLDLAGEE